MSRTGRRDTGAELRVRRELHRRGLRYRVDFRVEPDLRTRPDVAFARQKVALFVDGCFWHGCPSHSTRPKSNAGWWAEKLEANQQRDQKNTAALESRGWRVIRVWEHEDPADVAELVERTLRGLHD